MFSNLWISLAAGLLVAACSRALGTALRPEAVAFAAAGTFVVYTVDRLRDRERDRATSPARTAFVDRYVHELRVAGALALVICGWSSWALGARALLVPLAVVPLAFFHRRLKRFGPWKSSYITLAWVAIVVGLPWAAAPGPIAPALAGAVAATVAATIFANAIASNVRDDEAILTRRSALRIALALAVVGGVIALARPETRGLLALPLLTGLAVAGFQPGERYGLAVVDGALVAGAILALLG